MSRRKSIEKQYQEVVADTLDDSARAPRLPPRTMRVSDARGIVDDILDGVVDESDTHFAREELAALLARALSGEAAYLDLISRRTRRIPAATLDAILREDAALKRAGKHLKEDRCRELALKHGVSIEYVKRHTPEAQRGRPRKQPLTP